MLSSTSFLRVRHEVCVFSVGLFYISLGHLKLSRPEKARRARCSALWAGGGKTADSFSFARDIAGWGNFYYPSGAPPFPVQWPDGALGSMCMGG